MQSDAEEVLNERNRLVSIVILKPKQDAFRMNRTRTLALLLLGTPVLMAGQQSVPVAELVQQFKTSRVFWQQFEVAEKLAKSHDNAVLEQLEPYLKDEDRHVRGNAAFVFAAFGDDRGFEVIAGILKDRSDRPEGQGIPGGNWSVPTQIASDRYYAAHLFGDLKDSRAAPILIPLLHDAEVSSIVPWSLGQIGGIFMAAGLEITWVDCLASDDPEFESKAADILGLYLQVDPHAGRRLLLQRDQATAPDHGAHHRSLEATLPATRTRGAGHLSSRPEAQCADSRAARPHPVGA